MDALDHHYRVVHHDGDGQYQGTQRQKVQAEADEINGEERTNQRHRDGYGRDECGAQVLQEDVHHEEDEYECFDERLYHFVDGCEEEVVGALRDVDVQARGQGRLGFFQEFFDVLDDLRGVGAGRLEHDTRNTVVAVNLVGEAIGGAAELYARNVFEAQDFTVLVGTDHHVLKLGNLLQASLVAQGVLERLVLAFADRTGSGLDVLFGQSVRDIRGRQVVLCHLFGLQPDAHRIVGTHHHGVAHTGHALYLGNEVDLRVVFDKRHAVFIRFVVKREDHQHTVLTLLRDDAHAGHLGGQQALGLRYAVLHVHGCHVGVDTLLEGDRNTRLARVRSRGAHVVHVLHAVYLLFERGDNAVEHRLCVGTRVSGRHGDRRGRNVGVLRDRKGQQSQETQDYYQDRDYR